jgi:hypothetical protein
VAISKLRQGDKVLATNTATGKTSAEPVAAVLVRHDRDLYDLRVATAHGTAVIDTTRNHLFFDAGHHRWVKAAALKYGTRLRTPAGATATTRGGHDPAVTTGWMWDLNIPGGNDHDFYIHAADTAILVHNCGEGGDPAGNGGLGEVQNVEANEWPRRCGIPWRSGRIPRQCGHWREVYDWCCIRCGANERLRHCSCWGRHI